MSSSTSHTYEFKAEIQQLLDILIHSVYTSKDVFIRELVSNSADALEKARFCQVQGQAVHSPDIPLEICIATRKEGDSHRLIVSDTGIGMTPDEVRENIGTIAHSGAAAFLERLRAGSSSPEASRDLNLIGKFGVGFYSVFMAAEKVVLTSRSADPSAPAVRWSSEGRGSYSLESFDEDIPRGTSIEVHLKKEEARFAEKDTVSGAIRKYSNFVPFPIRVDGEQVNKVSAIWREPPSQVKDDQYDAFFKFISHDVENPILRLHLSVDAPIQFSALLFVPRTNTEILGFGEGEVSIQLYAKRVLIDAENRELLPKYLRFVRGVVESEDLPLNISRQTLQENVLVMKIRDTLTKKLFALFQELADTKPAEYEELWRTFGRILKEGHADFAHRERLHGLLRFNSSIHEDEKALTGLKSYLERMKAEQKAVYYLSGPSRESLERDPRLEIFRKKGIEVLYLYDLADEFVLGGIGTFEEKPIVSADQAKPEDLRGGGEDDSAEDEKEKREKEKDEEKREKEAASRIDPLIRRFREILGDRVTAVRASRRLVDSPACLVSDDTRISSHMDKMLRLIHRDKELPRRALELNAEHPLIQSLNRIAAAGAADPFLEKACEQILEGALLVDGYLMDPHRLVERMNAILADAAALRAPPGGGSGPP
ncbi:MAG: molecular chaperone HtpG [Planctomycetes bacterium]|nr:molecular chaperone HtpG [Planctomycetota bacterium]